MAKDSATVDLQNTSEIILYIQALLDLHDLLKRGWDFEWSSFSEQLSKAGWSPIRITQFLAAASQSTRYETLIDPPIKNKS